jgi:hypothetical protein
MTAVCIYNYFYTLAGLYEMAVLVSITIVCFFVLGVFVRAYVISRVFHPPQPDEAAASEEQAEAPPEEIVYLTDDDEPIEADEAYASGYADYADTEEI